MVIEGRVAVAMAAEVAAECLTSELASFARLGLSVFPNGG